MLHFNSFKNIYLKKYNKSILNKPNNYLIIKNKNNNDINNNYINTNNALQKNKVKSFLKLIRYNNILPTFFLSFTGGWIINPSIINLLYSKSFVISTINTILIMSTSMIINDLYDIEIDKVNNPNRPLITKEITIKEAIFSVVFLLSFTEYLNIFFLPENLQYIIHMSIIDIIIYTPIIKKILLVKNLFCAGLVSFTIFCSGLASSHNNLMVMNHNFGLLSITLTLIFFGSLNNELLLDIRDYEGDKKNNINTFPVVFGKKITWILCNLITIFNMLSCSLSLYYLYNNVKILGICFIPFIIVLINLYKIKNNNYSEESIVKFMKKINNPLFLLLLYICILAKL
jgi:geranylgeranylglycerol-phosphate geranylgeranyltransferase